MNKRKTISELPPTSVSMMRHIVRSHHFVYIYRNLYHPQQSTNLDSINFGWERENGLLTPAKFYKRLPVEYTVKSGCKKRCNGRCKCSEFYVCGNTCNNSS